MQHIELSPGGPRVSRLALGTAPLADLYDFVDEGVVREGIAAAIAADVNLFDTSPLYGAGLAELRLGASLRSCKSPRGVVISTKVGRRVAGLDESIALPPMPSTFRGGLSHKLVFDYSADGAKRSLEQSLLRLGVDHIDIVLIHDVDVFTHGPTGVDERFRQAMNGAYRALEELRSAGIIRAIGVGVNEAEIATRFVREGDFDTVLLAGRYSLLEQPALAELLPEAARRNVGVMLGGVFNSGILATGAIPGARYNYAPAPPEIVERVRRLEAVCMAHGVSLRDAALRFAFGHPAVKTVVAGMIGSTEVADNVRSMQRVIPATLWADLRNEGLLAADAPVPAA
jgi:D-threo-aldose 1-dehydrogenase